MSLCKTSITGFSLTSHIAFSCYVSLISFSLILHFLLSNNIHQKLQKIEDIQLVCLYVLKEESKFSLSFVIPNAYHSSVSCRSGEFSQYKFAKAKAKLFVFYTLLGFLLIINLTSLLSVSYSITVYCCFGASLNRALKTLPAAERSPG